MRKSPEAGFTLIELLIVIAVIGIIAAIAIPGLLRARMAGNESSAIASLRVINSSQHAYMSSCGNGFYASSLLILADPAPVGAGFISPDLGSAASIDKSGYHLTMAQGSEAANAVKDGCNPLGTAANLYTSYYASNAPIVGGQTGNRWFWTNATGAIFASTSNDFAAITIGIGAPGAGSPLQ
jgi:prepilin-type N-terminal cleavage/methylation domain-containing protein